MAVQSALKTKASARRQVLGVCFFLVAITWLVFGQTVRYDFVNYDDNEYVYANPAITSGLNPHGIIYAFSGSHARNWHPLTTLSHMLDCQLWGVRAGGHHLTNVVLHTIAAVLLFLVLQQMTGAIWQSAFVAALFAIHPLHVESVAWISERKDVLSAVFFMLTLGAYVRYVRSRSIGRYLTMSILFALGLMSKPMLVTLPFILLLLDYWPLKSFAVRSSTKRLILEKIPLLALSAAGGFVTLWMQQSSVARTEELPLIWRVANGLVTYAIYLRQMIWPVGLAVFYPHHGDQLPVWEIGLAIVLLALMSAGAIALRHKRPYLVTGWFWYLVMLLPVIGLIQVGSQAHADRYTYLPQIGLYLLLAWAITDICRASVSDANRKETAFRRNALQSRILAVAASVAIIALAGCAYVQASHWRNGESLWGHALAVTSGNFLAHDGLGECLVNRGRLDEAIDQFQKALNIAPGYPEIQTNLILALTRKGRTDEAIAHLQTYLDQHPTDAQAHYNLGSTLRKKGDSQGAIAAYEKALSIQARYPAAHYSLGIALDQNGQIDEALAHYQEAVKEQPNYPEAYYLLGNDLLEKGRVDDAIAAYEQGLKNRQKYPELENNIGLALLQKGRPSEAIAHWQNALAGQSDSVDSLNNLAWVLATFPESWIRNGRQALALAERANQLSRDNNPAILRTLAAAYAENGRFTEAKVTAERGLQLANAQENPALANILEGDLARYRRNAPVRTATQPASGP
ncbi:MAG TPA: tetratricopeptide repeat protein [Candidatus Udaeobacter sp.]|nr:tetratricopeptide repeat protein [Candidatus Udaeobacter sp.]